MAREQQQQYEIAYSSKNPLGPADKRVIVRGDAALERKLNQFDEKGWFVYGFTKV